MTIIGYMLASLLGLGPSKVSTLENPSFTPPVIVPTQWAISCPPERLGANGRILCSAEYLDYPRVFVNRTNEGMLIVFKTACGWAQNRYGKTVPLYRPIGLNVPLDSNASAEAIQRLLVMNVRNFPRKIKKVCGSAPPQGLKFEVDQSQMPWMIDAVFFRSEAR